MYDWISLKLYEIDFHLCGGQCFVVGSLGFPILGVNSNTTLVINDTTIPKWHTMEYTLILWQTNETNSTGRCAVRSKA